MSFARLGIRHTSLAWVRVSVRALAGAVSLFRLSETLRGVLVHDDAQGAINLGGL